MIRNAGMKDVKDIYALLDHFSDKGLLLGRSFSSLYDQLRDFKVYVESDGKNGRIVGVCALHVCWENLAEIRSLAIPEAFQRKGIATKLVKACLVEAVDLDIHKIFTLTYQPAFFKRLGFRPVDKNELPHKVWADCVQCPKFPDCNEEAFIWEHS